jgi:hypothetical protein
MTAYTSQTQTTLGQLCTALWDSNHGWMWYSLDSNQSVCSDASSTEMQFFRPLRHLGAPLQGSCEDFNLRFRCVHPSNHYKRLEDKRQRRLTKQAAIHSPIINHKTVIVSCQSQYEGRLHQAGHELSKSNRVNVNGSHCLNRRHSCRIPTPPIPPQYKVQ